MTSTHTPYADSTDPAVRRWWSGLSDASKRELSNSWRGDERADPLTATARRVASFLNQCLFERASEELAWESRDFYDYLVSQEVRDPAIYSWINFGHGSSTPTQLLDHGMFWPLMWEGRRWTIDEERCSQEQVALLTSQAAGG